VISDIAVNCLAGIIRKHDLCFCCYLSNSSSKCFAYESHC